MKKKRDIKEDSSNILEVKKISKDSKIPEYIPQAEHHVPFLKNLKIVMMKLWGYPTERVDQFFVYFDYMQVQTDVYRQRFNGDELAEIKW